MPPGSSANGPARASEDSRRQEVLSAQVQLLYKNANVGVGVTILTAAILAFVQWGIVPRVVVLAWWIYMILVSLARFALAQRYRLAEPGAIQITRWSTAFTTGACLAGVGWGAAGIFLYSERPLNQVFLIFVLGGMMLGAASILAPRPETFLGFLIPTGTAPTIRLLAEGDETHLVMGALTGVFTLAVVITTWAVYRTVESSLWLRSEKRELVRDLQAAMEQAETLNQELELKVHERTAELNQSTHKLRTEIAQREQVEEELLRARKLESIGVLAGGIAHDFNNFLTIVQGNIEVAKAQLDPAGPVHEILDQTMSACQRAALLSSQLLTFAKGGAPVRRVVEAANLITEAVHLARAGAPTSITTDVAEDLGFVQVDPGQIGQALHNILLNARQAMPEGGIIEVHAENLMAPGGPGTGPGVRIVIRDYGCGIPASDLPRIFDPYFTTKPGGSGLGLATAYAIIAKHGGRISVESKVAQGTEFTIDLPASQERPEPHPAEAPAIQLGTGRVLVMDDEEPLRALLKTVLSQLGYEVQSARDGAEAIALFEEAKAAGTLFDAVLLDLTVSGGMGGIETAARLKEIDPTLKLIVSSGYSDTSVLSDFGKYGFDASIPKPWTVAEISDVFRRVIVPDPDRKV